MATRPARDAAPARRGDRDDRPGVITRFRRGVIAGFSIPVLGLIILTGPVMLAWIVPGSDSVSATSALRAAALALLSGMHGGIALGGQLSTLPPLAVTALLGWLVCGPARRLDSSSGFGGLVVGFAVSCAALARWSSLGQTYAPVGRTAAAGAVFMLVVGGSARWAPQLWTRIGRRWQRVGVAAGAAVTVYMAAAAFTVAAQVVLRHSDVTDVQAKVAPGAGGLAILLLGVGAAPNAVIAAIGYLTGFGFDVGVNTSVSVRSVSVGPLPDFPMLAAIPRPEQLSAGGLVLLGLSAALAGLAAVRVLGPSGRGWRGLADLAAASVASGVSLGLLGWYARGGVGEGALRGVGVLGWQIGAGSAACVLAGSMSTAAVLWLRRTASRSSAKPALSLVASGLDLDTSGAGVQAGPERSGAESVQSEGRAASAEHTAPASAAESDASAEAGPSTGPATDASVGDIRPTG